jgi:hypothetical protein
LTGIGAAAGDLRGGCAGEGSSISCPWGCIKGDAKRGD